jgi:hypothetical protein
MKKKAAEFPVPVDRKVSQKGSVLVTNARPLERFVPQGKANPVGPERRGSESHPGEFQWPSHTDGRGRGERGDTDV